MVVINLRCRTRESCGHYFFSSADLSRQHVTDCGWGRFWYPLLISKSPISMHSWRFCFSLACVAWRFDRACKQAKVCEGSETARRLGQEFFIFLAAAPLSTGLTKPPYYACYCLSSVHMSDEARRVKNGAETTRNLFLAALLRTRHSFFPSRRTNRQRRMLKPKKLVINNCDVYFPVI